MPISLNDILHTERNEFIHHTDGKRQPTALEQAQNFLILMLTEYSMCTFSKPKKKTVCEELLLKVRFCCLLSLLSLNKGLRLLHCCNNSILLCMNTLLLPKINFKMKFYLLGHSIYKVSSSIKAVLILFLYIFHLRDIYTLIETSIFFIFWKSVLSFVHTVVHERSNHTFTVVHNGWVWCWESSTGKAIRSQLIYIIVINPNLLIIPLPVI